MRFSDHPSGRAPQEDVVERLIHRALDRGVRWFDTADVYTPEGALPGHNERLLAHALGTSPRGGDARIATKGGLRRDGKRFMPDGRASSLQAACEASLERLGKTAHDLYYLHTPDPRVPFERSVRALARLHEQGLCKRVGLANVRACDLRTALEIAPISAVQIEANAFTSDSFRTGVRELCLQHEVQLFLSSPFGSPRRAPRIARHRTFRALAQARDISPYTVALAWLLDLAPEAIPIPCTSREQGLDEILAARELALCSDERDTLDRNIAGSTWWRKGRSRPEPSCAEPQTRADVVLILGIQGAGKSSLTHRFTERDYVRLNRDELGGTLASLTKKLEERAAAGATRFVLDNTYATRPSRVRTHRSGLASWAARTGDPRDDLASRGSGQRGAPLDRGRFGTAGSRSDSAAFPQGSALPSTTRAASLRTRVRGASARGRFRVDRTCSVRAHVLGIMQGPGALLRPSGDLRGLARESRTRTPHRTA